MTRVCQFCKLEFGEKCGRCGSEDLYLLGMLPTGVDFYACQQCGYSFARGEDGKTRGICDGCHLQAMLAAMPAAGQGGAPCMN